MIGDRRRTGRGPAARAALPAALAALLVAAPGELLAGGRAASPGARGTPGQTAAAQRSAAASRRLGAAKTRRASAGETRRAPDRGRAGRARTGKRIPVRRTAVKLWEHVELKGDVTRALGKVLRGRDRQGRPLLEKLGEPGPLAAFALGAGAPLDEVPWDAESHQIRQGSRYVSTSLGAGSVRVGPDGLAIVARAGAKESQYYDTSGFDLFQADSDMATRWVVSYDGARPTRAEIGVLTDSRRDSLGFERHVSIASTHKEPSAQEIRALDRAVRSGRIRWGGRAEELPAVQVTHQLLADKGRGAATGRRARLEPKIHLRTFSRAISLRRTATPQLVALTDLARGRVTSALAEVRQAAGDGGSPELIRLAGELEHLAATVLDPGRLAAELSPALRAIDPAADTSPQAIRDLLAGTRPPAGRAEALSWHQRRGVVVEAVSAAYQRFGAELAQGAAVVHGPPRGAEAFRAWVQARRPDLARKTTFEPFAAAHARIASGSPAAVKRALAAFNRFGARRRAAGDPAFAGFEPLDQAGFRALGRALRSASLQVAARQIQAGGSAWRSLWFTGLEHFLVGPEGAYGEAFLTSKLAITEMVRPEAWSRLPAAKRNPTVPFDEDAIVTRSLSGEAELEPGLERAYLTRMRALRREVRAGRLAGDARRARAAARELEALEMVFGELRTAQRRAARLQGRQLQPLLEQIGVPGSARWGTANRSKREIAMELLMKQAAEGGAK